MRSPRRRGTSPGEGSGCAATSSTSSGATTPGPGLWGRLLALFGFGDGWQDSRHGLGGWLHVTLGDLRFLIRDRMLLRTALGGLVAAVQAGADRIGDLIRAALTARLLPGLDPNHWQTMRRNREGVTRIPVAVTPNGRRSSTGIDSSRCSTRRRRTGTASTSGRGSA